MHNEEIFLDIREFLKMERQEQDLWLQQFSKGFQGAYRDSQDGSVMDNPPNAEWVRRYNQLQENNGKWSHSTSVRPRQEKSMVGSISIHAASDGSVTLQVGLNTIFVPAEDVPALVARIQADRANAIAPMAAPSSVMGQNELVGEQFKTDRKMEWERNQRAMEQFVEASSKLYPKHQ